MVENYDKKCFELCENLSQMENCLESEKNQKEKLEKNYSELMKKFTDISKEFDEILYKKHEENQKFDMNLKIENEDLKGKINDFEEICDKMDGEIQRKIAENQKFVVLLEKSEKKQKEIREICEEKIKENAEKCEEKIKEIYCEKEEFVKENEGLKRNLKEKEEENCGIKEELYRIHLKIREEYEKNKEIRAFDIEEV